jgi:hypothetical protein
MLFHTTNFTPHFFPDALFFFKTMSTTFLTIDDGVITDDYDCNMITTISFCECSGGTVWDMVSQFPNVVIAYFERCVVDDVCDTLQEWCGKLHSLKIKNSHNNIIRLCVSGFRGTDLTVIGHREQQISSFDVNQLTYLYIQGCLVTDEAVACIETAQFLDSLRFTNVNITESQMRRVIDSVPGSKIRSFNTTLMTDANIKRLRDVFCKEENQLMGIFCTKPDKSNLFQRLNRLVHSRWFHACVTVLVIKKHNPMCLLAVLPDAVIRLILSEWFAPENIDLV